MVHSTLFKREVLWTYFIEIILKKWYHINMCVYKRKQIIKEMEN